jgi:hypothetical protein
MSSETNCSWSPASSKALVADVAAQHANPGRRKTLWILCSSAPAPRWEGGGDAPRRSRLVGHPEPARQTTWQSARGRAALSSAPVVSWYF